MTPVKFSVHKTIWTNALFPMARFLNVGERGKIRGSWYPAARRHVGAGAATQRRAAKFALLLCSCTIVLLLMIAWILQLKSILRVSRMPLQTHRLGGRAGSSHESLHRLQRRAERQAVPVAEVADVNDIEPDAAA